MLFRYSSQKSTKWEVLRGGTRPKVCVILKSNGREKLQVLKSYCEDSDWKDGDPTGDFIKHPKGIAG